MELLKEIKKNNIKSEVILITAYGEIYHAVEAMKAGACNFIEKNQFMDEGLKTAIKQVLEDRR
jgi:DNA-binding NtrC family response regulator